MNLGGGQVRKIPRDSTHIGKQFQHIDSLHGEIMSEVNKMNLMIKSGLQESQDDLLLAYRIEMKKVQRDYQEINKKINDDKAGAKLEAKMNSIRRELNWFKAETERLYKKGDEQQSMINKMRSALEVEEEDRDFYQQQLLKTRKINKNLEIQVKAFRREYPELRMLDSELKDSQDDSLSLDKLLNENLDNNRTPKYSTEDDKEFKGDLAVKGVGRMKQLASENEELKKKEQESVADINKLKKRLDRIAKDSRETRAQKVIDKMKDSEAKEFFLNCIDELRKEITKKQTFNKFPKLRRATTHESKFRQYGHINTKEMNSMKEPIPDNKR